jgi:UDPglucose 6-dehydrogenase
LNNSGLGSECKSNLRPPCLSRLTPSGGAVTDDAASPPAELVGMRIAIIGTGYVGLVSGTCFSEFGITVVGVDKDAEKIARLTRNEMPIFEPGLDELVASNVKSGRLSFTTDLAAAVAGADAVFIAVGTPSRRGDGHADLSFVYDAAREIAQALSGYTVVVTKSTVPVGTGREVARIIGEARPDAEFDVVSNPEFLREGSAINDFMRPDRVVIGAESARARAVMQQLYRVLYLIETPIVFTSLETSELIKYAANTFLATKITFINEIADLCEKVGADVHDVAKGIGLDGRIGKKFLHAGPGYGGSCFPKDTLALVQTARDYNSPLRIIETVVDINERRKVYMADKIIDACGGSLAGKTVAILGLTFKPNTDDMRDSPSLVIVPALQAAGAHVRAFDPEGMHEARKLLSDVVYCEDAYAAMDGADVAVILTEWNAFRALDIERAKKALKSPVMVDLRNVYEPAAMIEAGFHYVCVGRPDSQTSQGIGG